MNESNPIARCKCGARFYVETEEQSACRACQMTLFAPSCKYFVRHCLTYCVALATLTLT